MIHWHGKIRNGLFYEFRLLDVLSCINNIETNEFCLRDVYKYTEVLQEKYIHNHNVEAKIRQQLQFLRDKGFIEFLGRGHYKKSF